jgi:penicillin-binding protein 2
MRSQVDIDRPVMKNIRRGMVAVVSSRNGTAGRAQVPDVDVAGKTGTAQWGPKAHERTAAWFSGFAPADDPKYAFAVVYEGDAGLADIHGGTVAAPLVGKVLRELFKDDKPDKKKKKGRHDDDDDDDDNSGGGGNRDSDDAPVHHVTKPAPPPVTPKPSFWKRLFG